jgi:hypothetical protein
MAAQSKQPQIAVAEAIHLLQTFRGAGLTPTIYQIEKSLKGVSAQNYSAVLTTSGAKAQVLGAAGLIKQLAGQINVAIHALALGILLCLPTSCGRVKSLTTFPSAPEILVERLTLRRTSASRNSSSSTGKADRSRSARILSSRTFTRWRSTNA